jgi:DNA-binding GntR family transcriptional regulator
LLFEQTAELLRERIASGELPARKKLPTQEALADELGVSRGTILKATKILTDEGLIQWVKGRGLFTSDQDAIERFKRSRAKKKR